jgi:hypothetical protein
MRLCDPCVRVEDGFGGFLDLREKVFYFTILRGGLTPAGQVFISHKNSEKTKRISKNVVYDSTHRIESQQKCI